MKVCPQCDRTYHDDELNFCLMDGTPLVAGETQPTVVIAGEKTVPQESRPTTSTPKRRRGGLFWFGLTVGIIAAVIGAMIGGMFLYFLFNPEDEQASANRPPVRTERTPRAAASPRVSPTPSPADIDTDPTSERDPDAGPTEDEVTPISWYTMGSTFTGDAGTRLTFSCPPGGTLSIVWGSDVYMHSSSICIAAVHAGVFSLTNGGTVTIEYRPGRSIYGSTTRNGVTSEPYGPGSRSFVVIQNGEKKAAS